MFELVSEASIVVSAILTVAVGSIWYSPLFFGRMLATSAEHLFDDTEASRNIIFTRVGMLVLVAFVSLLFVAQFVLLSIEKAIPLLDIGVYLIGLPVSYLLGLTILEKRPVRYFFIHAGFVTITLLGSLIIISKWPW
jgi:hypothetical protein